MARNISDLNTPCFLVDFDKVRENCQRMVKTCIDFGVKLRPHTKTHKTVEAAVLQTDGTKRCITVSTLAEAEFYAENGFDDILVARPVSEDKIHRYLALVQKLEKLHIMVSGSDGLTTLENHIPDLPEDKVWSVVLELDAGYGRTGFSCDDPEVILEAAKKVQQSPKMRLEKLYYHCGNSYHVNTEPEREKLQADHIKKVAKVQDRLSQAGVTCSSGVGSTPTCSKPIKDNLFFTEFHPGNYVFYDYQQYLLNSCAESSIACRVMTRVIAHKPEKNMILVDCGFTALSHDGKYQRLPDNDFCIIQGESNLRLIDMSQEIGKIVAKEGDLNYKLYPVGTVLFILPFHSCATSQQHAVYYVHRGNEVITTWKPVKGW
uniref:D-serine dehydratase n=1 Tax=Lissachatina fulica TaxID=2315439 RepID=A0A2Z5X7G2_LISFU|nr:D-serine dehydratase [Lissachatina fulica]